MSERTPDSSEGLNGSEPSMEDILASIRKIISDDEPVALESPEDLPTKALAEISTADDLDSLMQDIDFDANDLTSDAVLDAAFSETDMASAEGESVDLNIDDVLAGLDDDILDSSPEIVSETVLEAVPETVAFNDTDQLDADDPLSAVLDDFSTEADLGVVESVTAENLDSVADVIEPESSIFHDDDDILALFNDDPSFGEEIATIDIADVETADVEAVDVEALEVEIDKVEVTPLASELDINPVDVADLSTENLAIDDDLEMDALLDDILLSPEGSDAPIEDIQLDGEDLDVEVPLEDDLTAELSGQEELSDLDLVKSLMADLADDTGDIENEDDLDALLAIPDVEDDVAALADLEAIATSETESDGSVLSEILDMTIEDELESFPNEALAADDMTSSEDVLGAEQDNIVENALPIEDLSLDDVMASNEAEIELPSLSDIAAAAEADALAVETILAPQAVAATAGLAAAIGGAALGGAAVTNSLSASDVEDEAIQIDDVAEILETPDMSEAHADVSETHIEQTPEPISTQETSMPVKAVKTDAILDDVTEAATAGAFAELNQVVEDKAVFSERGPRIGDLVQDALRPMLKEWLDANLKGIVERAVTKEVKRISSGK